MRILTCVKQVPDPESIISIDDSKNTIERGALRYCINRYDEYAVEEALLIREAVPGTVIEALSVGPGRAEAAVRRAMEMGADNGIHIVTDNDEFLSPYITAALIQKYARSAFYDLILTGIMAEDDMCGQVGPLLAEMLSIPCITSVMQERLSGDFRFIIVEREIEGGARERYEVELPALLAVQPGINRPRYPSLSNVLRAKKQAISTIHADVNAIAAVHEKIIRLSLPRKERSGIFIEGGTDDKSRALLAILHNKAFL